MREFSTLDRILKATEEELSAIRTIGPVIAKEVVEGLKKKRPLIEKLLKYVRLEAAPHVRGGERAGQPLQGKKFLFTGTLLAMERSKAERLVEEGGGEIASGVTQDLDYLVVGEGGLAYRQAGGAGSKLDKAKALQSKGSKIKIVSEKEWKEMIGPLTDPLLDDF